MEGLKRVLYLILGSILVCCLMLALFLYRDAIGETFANLFAQLSSSSSSGANRDRDRRGGSRGSGVGDSGLEVLDDETARPLFLYPELLETLDRESNQFIVVLGRGSYGNLWLVERQGGEYRVEAGPLYCRLGREGLTDDKTDGDWRTPTGNYLIQTLYGADSPSRLLDVPYVQITQGDVWVDDIYSVYYNRYYSPQEGQLADFVSYKTLSRTQGSLYLDIGYNSNCVPGRGAGVMLSAVANITVPTDGDISLVYSDMLRIAQWLDEVQKPRMLIEGAELLDWELEGALMPGYHYLSEDISMILEHPVYATGQNWLGEVLPGYYGWKIMVSNALGEALRGAHTQARSQHVSLMVLDGYRPQRANLYLEELMYARYFPAETAEGEAPIDVPAQLPTLLVNHGFQHSYGVAVDVTLVDSTTNQPLDMGGIYDPLSELAQYSHPDLSEDQLANRRLLREIMEQAGFTGTDLAWWHFELRDASHLNTYYDFAIPQ